MTSKHNKDIKKELDWEEELFELAEKYCQHNNTDEFNNCLYWIFRPVIVKVLKVKDKELQECKEESFREGNEYGELAGLTKGKQLCQKAKDKEFIEILNGLEMKKIDPMNQADDGYNLAIKELNNKIKQIKKKYA